MENDEERTPFVALLVERFDDFFDAGIYTSLAFGSILAWIWIGLTEGYPIFIDGRIDLISVLVLLGSFAMALGVLGFAGPCLKWLQKPAFWFGAGVASGLAGLVFLGICYRLFPFSLFAEALIVRCGMVVLGGSAAVIVMACGAGFACLRPMSGGVGFTLSVITTFVLFFCLNCFEPVIRGIFFCALPLVAAGALIAGRRPVIGRLQLRPPEKQPYASGFKSMCIAFCVFFFAIGAKCALEPEDEFTTAADSSMVSILLLSLVFVWAIGFKRRPIGVFKMLKGSYTGAVLVLTISIAIAPLSLDPFAQVIYNADVVVMIMVLWLLTTFTAHFNEKPVEKVVALAIGASALGLAIGWATGTWLHVWLGHERSYPTIGLACATAVFSTVGFSSRSFPRLTNKGMGAQKVAKVIVPYNSDLFCDEAASAHGLSDREKEVLRLMVVGYGAEGIAEKLVVSYHTARTHIRNIYKKMDIHSQRDLLDTYEGARERYEEQTGENER